MDTVEEEVKGLKAKVHTLESGNEELERTNKQLQRSLDTLESEFFYLVFLAPRCDRLLCLLDFCTYGALSPFR